MGYLILVKIEARSSALAKLIDHVLKTTGQTGMTLPRRGKGTVHGRVLTTVEGL